jgi:hypothetical protein
MNHIDKNINDKYLFIIQFLNLCGLQIYSITALDNFIFERDLLLKQDTYEKVREIIPLSKKFFSSSYLNALHDNAQQNQKWPLINIVRQFLSSIGYKLVPIRKANGYSKNKQKLYKRFFKIQKLIL